MKILVIGDTHVIQSREQAIIQSFKGILSQIKKEGKFDKVIFLGDIFHKYPNAFERELFSRFLKKIISVSKEVHFIKGTDTHEYNSSVYNLQDLVNVLPNCYAHDELEIDNFVFGHYEVRGTKYVNGFLSKSEKEVCQDKQYILGHIHSPNCSFSNICYLGSIYKVSFAEKKDQKRFLIIKDGKMIFYPIDTRSMVEINTDELVKDTPYIKEKEIDLKISGKVPAEKVPFLNSRILTLKKQLNIEYYQQDISVENTVYADTEKLDLNSLMESFCKENKINLALVHREIERIQER